MHVKKLSEAGKRTGKNPWIPLQFPPVKKNLIKHRASYKSTEKSTASVKGANYAYLKGYSGPILRSLKVQGSL